MARHGELLIEEKGSICTLVLNRPEKRNLTTPNMLLQLERVLKKLKEDETVRCVIIRGAGEKAFSSGYDISAIGENDMMRDYEGHHPLIIAAKSIENFPYPVIAMINGHAFGAGLELAVTCDMRISVDNAMLGMPPAKLGVIYTFSGIRKFLNLVGLGYTKELFLVGNAIDSIKAERIGLVNYIKPREEIEEFTYGLAIEMVKNAPLSMKTMKLMINKWQQNQNLNKEEEEKLKKLIIEVQSSGDYKEGQQAFAEKRKPKFKGR
ncbi:enoyl-CoA hydratase-related protein [Desulfobacterota bacterium AH_259_B03_O07]|nr:enoyl-CoA hydratase-related protein [Desulfobacterota bacterium AH_259_B03_O07]